MSGKQNREHCDANLHFSAKRRRDICRALSGDFLCIVSFSPFPYFTEACAWSGTHLLWLGFGNAPCPSLTQRINRERINVELTEGDMQDVRCFGWTLIRIPPLAGVHIHQMKAKHVSDMLIKGVQPRAPKQHLEFQWRKLQYYDS